jgi:hypothetical protein
MSQNGRFDVSEDLTCIIENIVGNITASTKALFKYQTNEQYSYMI